MTEVEYPRCSFCNGTGAVPEKYRTDGDVQIVDKWKNCGACGGKGSKAIVREVEAGRDDFIPDNEGELEHEFEKARDDE